MNITQDEVIERQTMLHIELEDSDLDPYMDRAYRRVVQRINIPGFRKGKAPRSIVQQYYGKEQLLNEVLDSMLPELTSKAIAEKGLETVGLPDITIDAIDPFQFSATVSLSPIVDLGDYRNIRVEKEEGTYGPEDIDERIEQLRISVAPWEPVERDVTEGDMISASIKATVDGNTLIDENDAVYLVTTGSDRPFPGLSEKLIGSQVNNPITFDIPIPAEFSDPDLAGKSAVFDVAIKDLKERALPALDDEFAQSIGDGHESLDQLREEVENSIREEVSSQADQSYNENILSAFTECASVEISPLLIQRESAHMINEQERMVTQAKMQLSDYLQSIGKTREQLEEESLIEATSRLTRSFILSKIADEEKIEVTDDEIDGRISDMFADSDQEVPESSQTEEVKSYMRRQITSEKTMDLLRSIATGDNVEPQATADQETK